MSRRKQSRPRPVKALVDTDDQRSIQRLKAACDVFKGCDNNSDVVPSKNDDDVDSKLSKTRNYHMLAFDYSSSSSTYVSQPSTSPSSVPPVVSTSAALFLSSEETARCEQFHRSIPLDQEATSLLDIKVGKCVFCSAHLQGEAGLKRPTEGKDYFIDSDGTLAIRNGVCPRSLALALFSEVCAQRSKYSNLLGENLLKFLLNLKQIVTKNNKTCPGENPSDFVNAQNVLNDFLIVKDRLYQLTNGREGYELSDKLKMKELNRSEAMESDIISTNRADYSINGTFPKIPLLHDEERNLIGFLSELPSSEHNLGCNSNCTGNIKSGASDNESSSRVTSPSPSLSSVNSGPSLSDKAKQTTSTKRGCKILPVASTDGQTHYPCPVCHIELASDHELTVHIRSHNQSGQHSTPNTCTICGKTLSSQSSLDRHMLVHSGERPFKCKICDLSFTTNGNMHRHSRIHEKSGITTSKPISRKHSDHKTTVKEDSSFHNDDKNGSVVKAHQSTSTVSEFGCTTMDLVNTHKYQECAQLQPYYRLLFPSNSSHHLAFPYPHLLQYPPQMTLPFLQTLVDPFTGKPLASCVQIASSLSRLNREPSPDLRVQKKWSCNMCDAVFTNQFSLESHMETHVIVDEKLEAENDSACKSCKTIAKSEASLLLHSLKYHKTKDVNVESDTKIDEQKCAPSSPLGTNTSSVVSKYCNNVSGNAVGFQNLGFASFTTKKFPLIAKAFCENHPSTRAFRFPVYKCEDCELEFPVEGAKHLHEASHVPEEYTMCPKCNCHFSEPSRLQEHMQKHVADLKFEETFEHNDIEPEKNMLQYHFLAQFGLTRKEEIDQILNRTDIYGRGRLMNSDDEENKMLNSDDDDNSLELNQMMNSSKRCDQRNTCCKVLLPMNIPLNTAVSNTEAIRTSTLSYLRASQNLPEVSEEFLPDTLKFSSISAPVDNNSSPKVNDGSLKVLDVSVPPVFLCKYCSLELTSARALKYHLYTHKSTSHFQCKVCTYSSTDKNTLLRHMRTHSGERPYKCVICEYSFTTKANCERHLRQKHGLQKTQLSEKLVCNKYLIANKNMPRSDSANIQSFQNQNSVPKASEVDLLSWKCLQQDNYVSPDCDMGYICKTCLKTSPSYSSILQHISLNHPDIEQHSIKKMIVFMDNSTHPSAKLTLASPPHAHLKSPLSSTVAIKGSTLNRMSAKQEHNFSGSFENTLIKSDRHYFSEQQSVLVNKGDGVVETSSEKPLDFSKQQKYNIPLLQREQDQLVKLPHLLPETSLEVIPVDLSVSKSSHYSPLMNHQIQNSKKRRYPDVPAAAQKSEFTSTLLHSYLDCNGSFVTGVDSEDDTDDKEDKPGAHTEALISIKIANESDSSCELASVNKILDATDAQNFQNFLHIPETEDEQEMYISESASGDEDSNVNLGLMNSHLQAVLSRDHFNTKPAAAVKKTKQTDRLNSTFTDPSRMSEQSIAELIEKVSQENGLSPAKKKKNSYADSPHKFSCPFCPRCFPWHSSLNRHLLTHTGQKPFKCPRCPVIFSTKSNRERHLIRKHNVNMLDPASRSTMDRPYKCHICMFSSFSTQKKNETLSTDNLMKHYKDKHKGVAAPARGLDKPLCDGELEDSLLNGGSTSYEDEEEYNSIIEMQGGLSDREIMFENYTQDSDSNQSGTNGTFFHDPYKKQNTVFNLNISESSNNYHSSSGNSSYIDLQPVSKDIPTVPKVVDDSTLKSILHTGENRKTNQNWSRFIITSDIKCHKRPFSGLKDVDIHISANQHIQCLNCDQTFTSHKSLAIHEKNQHSDLPFKCTFCEDSFATRLPCLQHFEEIHQEAWAVLKERNEIGNIQVFSTRLDKLIDKLCKKEQDISENHEIRQQDWALHRKNDSRDDVWLTTSSDLAKSTVVLDEQPELNLDSKLKLQKKTCVNNGFEDMAGLEVIQKSHSEVFCALCPKRLKSLQDLRRHMYSHVGRQKVHSDQLKIAVNSNLTCLPSTDRTPESYSCSARNNRKNKGSTGNDMDMLHNLLGVESSTIDQIFESSDSAASLLGVCL